MLRWQPWTGSGIYPGITRWRRRWCQQGAPERVKEEVAYFVPRFSRGVGDGATTTGGGRGVGDGLAARSAKAFRFFREPALSSSEVFLRDDRFFLVEPSGVFSFFSSAVFVDFAGTVGTSPGDSAGTVEAAFVVSLGEGSGAAGVGVAAGAASRFGPLLLARMAGGGDEEAGALAAVSQPSSANGAANSRF